MVSFVAPELAGLKRMTLGQNGQQLHVQKSCSLLCGCLPASRHAPDLGQARRDLCQQ